MRTRSLSVFSSETAPIFDVGCQSHRITSALDPHLASWTRMKDRRICIARGTEFRTVRLSNSRAGTRECAARTRFPTRQIFEKWKVSRDQNCMADCSPGKPDCHLPNNRRWDSLVCKPATVFETVAQIEQLPAKQVATCPATYNGLCNRCAPECNGV